MANNNKGNIMRTRSGKPSLVVLGAAIALTACGGGSDGNGNSSGDGSSAASSRYDGPTAPVHISAANADGVMAAVFSHLPDAVSGFGIIDAMPFLASNRSVAQHASNASTAKGGIRTYASSSQEEPCPLGGTFKIESDIEDGDIVGEDGPVPASVKVSVEYVNCESHLDADFTQVMHGSMATTILLDFDPGDPGSYSTTTEILADYTASVRQSGIPSGDFVTLYGEYTLRQTFKNGRIVATHATTPGTFYGKSLQGTKSSTLFSGLDYRVSCEADTDKCTYGIDVDIASTALGGSVAVKTLEDFEVIDSYSNPSSGSLTITGADNASITLSAMSDGMWVLVDYNLEPPYQAMKSWDELFGSQE